MASHRDEDRLRARTEAMFAVSDVGCEITATTHGTGRLAGTKPRLWRPYRGIAQTVGVQETAFRIGAMMVERGEISQEELQALRAAAAFRGAFQGLGPENDAGICGAMAIGVMREQPAFTPRDCEIAEEAFAALADTRGETLSPLQELFVDAHNVDNLMPHSPQAGMQRCIEGVTTDAGLVLPRSMAELGVMPIDPDKVDAAFADAKWRTANQEFHRPEVTNMVDDLDRRSRGLELLEELHTRFQSDVDLGIEPGTALVRGLDTVEFRDQHFGNLPSAEDLLFHQQENFERHYGREPRPGEIVEPTWEQGPDAARMGRATVDETLSAVDRVLHDEDARRPGALGDLGEDGGSEPEAPPSPRIDDGPTSGY